MTKVGETKSSLHASEYRKTKWVSDINNSITLTAKIKTFLYEIPRYLDSDRLYSN